MDQKYTHSDSYSSDDLKKVVLWFSGFLGVIFFITLVSLSVLHKSELADRESSFRQTAAAGVKEDPDVLAEFTASDEGSFVVNAPIIFNNDLTADGRTINLGKTGTLIAGNIVSNLTSGTGIQVISDGNQGFTVRNSDKGSDQKMFSIITVGTNTIAADTNKDTLDLDFSDGFDVSVSGKKITLKNKSGSGAGSGSTSDTSGFLDGGTDVGLKTITDTLSIGAAASQGKVTIVSTDTSQVSLVVQAISGQTSDLAEFKDSTGSAKIIFDKDGNATFNGSITQNGGEINGDRVAFTGSGNTLSLDIKSTEPTNLLTNSGVDTTLTSWTTSTPTASNIFSNATFNSNLTNWTGSYVGVSFPENFGNSTLESNFNIWDIAGGDLFTVTEYDTTAHFVYMTAGPDGNFWGVRQSPNRVSKLSSTGVILAEYALSNTPSRIVSGPDGNLWVTGTFGVDKVTTSGIVTNYTGFGTTAGQIIRGPDGNLWVLGTSLYKVSIGGSILATYPYTCSNTRQMITDGTNIYINCLGDRKIYKFTTSGVETVMATLTSVNSQGLVYGSDGNFWALGENSGGSYKVTPAGAVTLYANQGCSFSRFDATLGYDGNAWGACAEGKKFYKVNTAGVMSTYSTNLVALPQYAFAGTDGQSVWTLDATGSSTYIGKISLAGPAIVTSPTFSFSSGSLRVPSSTSSTTVTQSLALQDKGYTLSAYAYISPSIAVNSTYAQLMVNGSAIDATYTSAGGGWYKISADITGSTSTVSYGVRINPNVTVYLDNISLVLNTTGQYDSSTFYTNFGSAKVISPAGNSATFYQNRPLINGTYTLTGYAYTNGGAVTSSDVQLSQNGSTLTPTITSTATPGWYKLTAPFTLSSEATIPVGFILQPNKTVYIDDTSLTLSSVTNSVNHVSTPTFDGTAGSVEINAIGRTPVSFTQSVTVGASDTYAIFARIYDETPGENGSAIDTSKVKITINGAAQSSTTVTATSGGFYEMKASSFMSAGTYTVGIQVQTGYRVIADEFSFQQGTGNDKTVLIENSGSGLAKLNVESTTTLNAGVAENQAQIIVGTSGQSANLSEWRDYLNNVMTVVDATGHIGIGSANPSLQFVDVGSKSSGALAGIVNTYSTDSPAANVLRLATGVASSGTDTRFIQFYANATNETNGTGVGRIRLNNGGVAYESGGADFAEYFSAETKEISPGEVVSINSDGQASRSIKPFDQRMLGIVSSTAAFVGNAPEDASRSAKIVVGLVGQMDVKVSTMSGTIKKGDFITTSNIPGVGMKAGKKGTILGIALSDFEPEASSSGAFACGTDMASVTSCGKVRAYVQPRWYDPAEDGNDVVLAAFSHNSASGSGALASDSAALSSGLTTDTTVQNNLTVAGKTNLSDVFITGNLSVGLLNVQGLTESGEAALNTLTGDLLLQSQASGGIKMENGKVEIDKNGTLVLKEGNVEVKKGVIKGNDQFLGTITLPAGKDTVRVERSWEAVPSTLQIEPEYNTTTWVTDVSSTGFTIHVGTTNTVDTQLHWMVFFK